MTLIGIIIAFIVIGATGEGINTAIEMYNDSKRSKE